jgi:hypothetical protein
MFCEGGNRRQVLLDCSNSFLRMKHRISSDVNNMTSACGQSTVDLTL